MADDAVSTSSLSKILPISLKKSSVGPFEQEPPGIKLKTFITNSSTWKQNSLRQVKRFNEVGESCKLFHASRAGRTDLLRQLDLKGDDLIQRDSDGNTALHHGARSNQTATVKMLLDLGVDINVKNNAGFTPVHLAARFNCNDVMQLLISHGADVSITNNEEVTPLHSASRRGYESIAGALLEASPSTVNIPDVSNTTPFHTACAKGHRAVCKLLLVHGADIMATTTDLKTALHLAVLSGNVGVVEDLIKAASKLLTLPEDYLSKRDLDSKTSLEYACYRGCEEIAQLLLSNGADLGPTTEDGVHVTPLHAAAKYGYSKVVDFLVSSGSDVDIRNDELKTPLHGAAALNQLKIITYLLDKGATADPKDGQDQTPFLEAVEFGSKEAAELLLNRGADLHAVDLTMKNCVHLATIYGGHAHSDLLNMLLQRDDGKLLKMMDQDLRTPVHFAAAKGEKEVLGILLDHGFAPDSPDVDEKTPLHLAAENDAWECVALLTLASCPTLNRGDEQNRTALHLAAAKGYSKTCEVLSHLGASAVLRDINRSTPLHLAVTSGSLPTVMNFLDSRRSNTVEEKDKGGNTALLLACQYGHVNIVQALLDNGADVTARNDRKQTCLDVAIEWWEEAVARTLVQHDRWREVMSNTDLAGRCPMEKLIEQLPAVASIVLDRCFKLANPPPTNPELEFTFDFEFLDPGPDAPEDSYFGPKVMADNEREDLLNHSVTQALLQWKWFTLGKFLFYLNFYSYQCFVVLLSIFISTERGKISLHSRDTADFSYSSIIEEPSTFSSVMPMLLFIFIMLHHLKIIYQVVIHPLFFFKHLSNLVDLCGYVSTLVFLLPYMVRDAEFYPYSSTQWSAAISAIFFTYLNEVLFIGRLKQLGTYVTMYFNVLATFLKVMLTFVVFIIGFALLYYVLLKEQDDFSTIGYAFVKTTVMMIGEMDYSGILTDNVVNNKTVEGTDIPYVPLPTTTYIAFYIFCFTMPILLMNLLVGLAVGDIDAIQKSASLRNLIEEVNYIRRAEKGLPMFIRRKAYRKSLTLKPNQMTKVQKILFYGTEIINLQSYLESLMTSNSQAPKKDQEEEKTGNQRYEEKIASLESMLREQGRLLSVMAEKLQVNE